MAPDDLTSEWLSEVFGTPVSVTAAAPIGDGHVSTTIRLTVAADDPAVPASVVAKIPAQDDRSRLLALSVRSYEREVKLFRELAPTVDIRMPHCYHADWDAATNDYVVLLEDMAPAEQGDQLAGCTVDRAELAVRELTRLHGPRWNDPALGDIEWLSGNEPPNPNGIGAAWSIVFPGFASTYEPYLTAEQLALAERFGQHIGDFFAGRQRPYSIVHTDYRLDNMLFGTAEGGPPITVVDWGSPAHGMPVTDLSYFCGAGLVVEDRRAHERDLVALYVETLRADYGVDVDADWAWEQYRREAFHGLFITALTSQMVTMNDRSQDMFGAMASRHLQHALDLDALSLI